MFPRRQNNPITNIQLWAMLAIGVRFACPGCNRPVTVRFQMRVHRLDVGAAAPVMVPVRPMVAPGTRAHCPLASMLQADKIRFAARPGDHTKNIVVEGGNDVGLGFGLQLFGV